MGGEGGEGGGGGGRHLADAKVAGRRGEDVERERRNHVWHEVAARIAAADGRRRFDHAPLAVDLGHVAQVKRDARNVENVGERLPRLERALISRQRARKRGMFEPAVRRM